MESKIGWSVVLTLTIGLIKKFKSKDYTVFIVTSRQQHLERPHDNVKKILQDLKLEVDGVFYQWR